MSPVIRGLLISNFIVVAVGRVLGTLSHLFFSCSLAGPIHDLVKRASDKAEAEYSSLVLKGRSMGERLVFSAKQTELLNATRKTGKSDMKTS